MIKKIFRLTDEGVAELKKEFDGLISQRAVVAERIKIAREWGDLSENNEYQSARTEQERLENRIAEINNILKNVELIKKPKGAAQVQLGSSVKLKSEDGKTSKEFQVVGTVEADPLNGKISDESPIGKALMGKKVGELVKINTHSEAMTYKISSIA